MPPNTSTNSATAPIPTRSEMGVIAFTIDNKEFKINSETKNFNVKDSNEIKELLKGKLVTLLCSVGSNKHCEGEYVKTQIKFLYKLLEEGIISGVDVIIADSLQRHNHQINNLRSHTSYLGSEITTLVKKLVFKGTSCDDGRAELMREIGRLQAFTPPESNKTYSDRQIIRFRLKNIRKKITEFSNSSTEFVSINEKKLKDIFRILNHFDLKISLHALEVTLNQGQKWYKKLKIFFTDLNHPNFRILFWRDLFGSVYSIQQQEFDNQHLIFLKKEYKEYLATLSNQTNKELDDYEKALLAGTDEIQTEEEKEIIAEQINKLQELYQLSKFDTIFNNTISVSESIQKERFRILNNLYTTGNKDGKIDPNFINNFAKDIDIAGDEYISRNDRKQKRLVAGISQKESSIANSTYLIEEGIIFGEQNRMFAYPRKSNAGVAAILIVFENGPWGFIALAEDGKLLVDDDYSDSSSDGEQKSPSKIENKTQASQKNNSFKETHLMMRNIRIQYGDLTVSVEANTPDEAEKFIRAALKGVGLELPELPPKPSDRQVSCPCIIL